MTQYEAETLFEAPLAHESSTWHEASWEMETPGFHEFSYESAPGTHETAGFGQSGESSWETAWESAWESKDEGGAFVKSGYETEGRDGPSESAGVTGSYESAWKGSYEDEAAWENDEADPFLGNIGGLVSGALSALGLGEQEYAGELEWSGESDESDQFLGQLVKAAKQALRPAAQLGRGVLPGVLNQLAGLVPGGQALKGVLGGVLPGLLREGEPEILEAEAQMLGSRESLGEIGRDERSHEAALTEILANEAVLAESEDEAVSLLATSLPITITIMGGRRALRPILPAYAQAQRRLVASMRRDPRHRQLLRAVPSIDRRAVWLLNRWRRTGRPVTGQVAVNALAAAARDVLGSPRLLNTALVRNGAVRIRTAPMRTTRLQTYRPGSRRVRPYGVRAY